MLGRRIKKLRTKQGLTPVELSEKSGISVNLIEQLENEIIDTIEYCDLLKISSALNIRKAVDFATLMNMNRRPRQFNAYCVGLVKTGTTSMAEIFPPIIPVMNL